MYKFKIGDRVKIVCVPDFMELYGIKLGDTATVLEESGAPYVRMDRNINGHDCSGLCETGHGAVFSEDQLELATDYSVNHVQPLPKLATCNSSKQPNTITLILGNTAYEITGENITIKIKEL